MTLTVKFDTPLGPVGVPVMCPDVSIFSPAGNPVALLIVKVYGVRPPVAAMVWLYAVPSTSAGRLVVVMAGAGGKLIRMLKFCVLDSAPPLLESVTFTVKVAVPFGPVGVPVICPDISMFNPAGRLPVLIVNVSVPAPPDDATVWLYAVPSVPAGRDVVGIAGGGVMLMVTAADFEVSATEVAVTVAVGSAAEVDAL